MAIRLEGFFYKDEINVPFQKKAEQLKKLRHVDESLLREYPLLSAHLDNGMRSLANSPKCRWTFESEPFKKRVYTSYYRAKKIQECIRNDHFIFFHSRSLALKVVSYFIKKMVEATHSGINLKGFDLLRYPENSSKDTKSYMKNPGPDTDFEGGTMLLSVNPNLLSEGYEECATHFLLTNESIKAAASRVNIHDANSETRQEDLVRKICTPILSDSLAKEIPKREELMETCIKKVQTLFNDVSKLNEIFPGELILICIPKPLIYERPPNPHHEDSLLYRCSVYGIPCPSLPADKSLELLEEEQKADETLQEDNWALEKMERDLREQCEIQQEAMDSLRKLKQPNRPEIFETIEQLFEEFFEPLKRREPKTHTDQTEISEIEKKEDKIWLVYDAAGEKITALGKKIAELKAKPKPPFNVQYRLFTDKLTPKKGIQIIGIDPMGKDLKKDYYKDAIKKMVAELPQTNLFQSKT